MSIVQKLSRDLLDQLYNQYWKAANNVYSLIGQPAPRDFHHIQNEMWRSGKKYFPQLYPGKITLFRADQARGIYPDPMLGWERLAADRLEIHEVRGSDHESIVIEPHVRGLAKELKRCLEKGMLEAGQAMEQAQLYLVDKTGVHLSLYLAMSSFLIQ